MAGVKELRVALTVQDFDAALRFYRDALGLEQVADWTSDGGRVVVLSAGRATLELLDEAQAATIDASRPAGACRGRCDWRWRSPTAGRWPTAWSRRAPSVSRPPSRRRGGIGTRASARRTGCS
jgi:catechol 2,3-dioxygenase-like lactoylglutathione lyase family enzyme